MLTEKEYLSNRNILKKSYNRFYSKEKSYQGKTFEEVLNECMNAYGKENKNTKEE